MALDYLYKRSVPAWIVAIIVMLFGLAIVGTAILVDRYNRHLPGVPIASKLAVRLSQIPGAFEALFRPRAGYAVTPTEMLADGLWLSPKAGLRDPGAILVLDVDGGETVVRLLRLADARRLRSWRPRNRARGWQGDFILHPMLLEDGGIVYLDPFGMQRLDACGNRVWASAPGAHHSIERDAVGDLWTPGRFTLPSTDRPAQSMDTIVKLSPDGRVLLERRLDRIFAANGLAHLVEGRPYHADPYHLNDVEPVLADGPYWKRGDLFLSLRHLSMVLLYRPSNGSVIWWKIGPWTMQHDVQLLDDHRIAIFDNRVKSYNGGSRIAGNNSEAVVDFSTGAVSYPFEAAFHAAELRTRTQGRGLILPGGDIVAEETDFGRVLRMDGQGNVRWRYILADNQGNRFALGWTRYLDPVYNAQGLAAAASAKCE